MFFFEINEEVSADYLTTIRILAVDLGIRLVLDDTNKMDVNVHHQLLDLGIELVRTDQIADLIMSDGSRAFFTESLNNKKTVITASSIERLPLTVSELVCPVNSLVTPLAKEVAARKKVILID